MDESWRMRMGRPSLAARRRVSEDLTSRTTTTESGRSGCLFNGSDSGAINVEDFNDVFGGPPKSVLNRKLSCDLSGYDYFYREIFRRPEDEAKISSRSGRRLPEFRIPLSHGAEEKAGFYNDIFGSSSNCGNSDGSDDRREKKSSSSSRMWRSLSKSKWTSKSKSNSSSVLSYEEISPITIQPGIREEDVGLTSIAAKLRPINVPCRWNSTGDTRGIFNDNQASESQFQNTKAPYTIDDHYPSNEYIGDQHFTRCSNPGFSQQFPSPEADNPYQNTVRISLDDDDDDSELDSPSSANSMFNAEEDEDFSSYVIEINSGTREVTNESADIDEAIAWAKEKFQGCSSSCQYVEERSMVPLAMAIPQNVTERFPVMPLFREQSGQTNNSTEEQLGTSELDERISSWSSGNDTNIRLLLSTLHHILWASSGWNAIPLSNLIQYSQVKKAYQKARLCIHPDKLQQRGATTRQKYIAENVFSTLQNAWDSFISQETIFS